MCASTHLFVAAAACFCSVLSQSPCALPIPTSLLFSRPRLFRMVLRFLGRIEPKSQSSPPNIPNLFLGELWWFINGLLNTTQRRASRKRSPIPNHEGPCQPWGASALTHGRTVVAHSVVGVGFVWKNMRSAYCKKLVVVGLSAFTWDQLGRGGAAMHQNPRAS